MSRSVAVALGLTVWLWAAAGDTYPGSQRVQADACAPSYQTMDPDALYVSTHQFFVTWPDGGFRQWVFGSAARCREAQLVAAEILTRLGRGRVTSCR